MINKNMKKLLLFITLCILLIGIVSATDVDSDDTTDVTPTICEKTTETVNTVSEVKDNAINDNKQDVKKESKSESVKTATNQIATKISIDYVPNVSVDDSVIISGTFTDVNNNPLRYTHLKVDVNGEAYYSQTDTYGDYFGEYLATTPGTKTITVSWAGNDRYAATNSKRSFNVEGQYPTKIVLNNIKDVNLGDSVTISGYYYYDQNKPLRQTAMSINLNGAKYYARTNDNGYFTYNYKTTKMGTNTVTVSYPGNTRFKEATITKTFNVKSTGPQYTYITLNNIPETKLGNTATISGYYYYNQAKPLRLTTMTLNINGAKYYAKTDNNGYFTYNYKTNKAGTNTVTVSYPGNTNFKAASTIKTFNVKSTGPQYTYITLNNINDVAYEDYVIISGHYYYGNNIPLRYTGMTIKINSENYFVRTDNNGYFSYKYQTEKIGKNTVTVSYAGNNNFLGASITKSFNVKITSPIPTYITLYAEDTKIGEYTSIDGFYEYGYGYPLIQTTITLNINGQKYYTKTDNNGYFSYNYKTTKIGTNTVTASYPGNSNFKYASTTESFTVYNLELYTYKYYMGDDIKYQRVGNDYFYAWYQTFDAQHDKGVHLEVYPINMEDLSDPPNNLIIDAKFIFKDSNGYIYSDSYEEGYGNSMYHSLVSGYTPYKILVSYRKMTEHEKYLWNNGYGYDPFTASWIYYRY